MTQTDPNALLFAEGMADHPHAAYHQLLDECPVTRTKFAGLPSVYVSRYEDVLFAMRHPEIFSSEMEALSIGQEQPLLPLQVDPPLHTRYRRLLNPEFVPRKIAELEPDVRVQVNRIIDTFADAGGCDFHEDFATPLPSTIFLRLMGLPQSDLPTFLRWRDNIIRPATNDFEEAARLRAQTGKDINAYFTEAIAHRRTNPDEGLLTRLVHGRIDGEQLREDELLGICQLMLLGGLDTVTATLDCMIVHLAAHPEQRRRLIAEPSHIGAVVEELLRHQTPVMVVPRVVRREATMGGVDLHPGDRVTLVLGAANSDERAFPHPDDADFDRGTNHHLAFGGGHHLCLGAHLARLELRVALEEFHRRIPDYRIPDGVEIHYSFGIRQAEHLPLVFG